MNRMFNLKEKQTLLIYFLRSNNEGESGYILVGKDLLTNVLMLDIGYRLQTFTIELQSAAFAFLLADQEKTQQIVSHIRGKKRFFFNKYFNIKFF
jgi:hypothetical protein